MQEKTATELELLFSEFPKSTKEDWVKKVSKDLKDTSFEEALRWKVEENIVVDPLYTDADTKHLHYLKNANQERIQNILEKEDSSWQYLAIIAVDKNAEIANKQILEALSNGAQGVLIDLRTLNDFSLDYNALLEGVFLDACMVSFELNESQIPLLKSYENFLSKSTYDCNKVQGIIYLQQGTDTLNKYIENQLLIEVIFSNFSSIRSFGYTSDSQAPSSERIAQALLYTETLMTTLSGIEAGFFERKLCYRLLMQNSFFEQIACLKAFRTMLRSFIKKSLGLESFSLNMHSETKNLATGNNNENLLSNTTQAMSAILGDSDFLSISAHDNSSSDFSQRIARNVSNLLREESYLSKVVNPLDGSYYLDILTDQISRESWTKFQAIKNG